MAEFPALPLWTDAYLSDTHPDLTLEEHGAYLLLLIASWRRPDCALPNDDKWLCRFLGVHGNQWRKLRSAVLERFFTLTEAGNWQQKRLRKERDFVEKKRGKQRENAEKRWSETKDNNCIADAKAMPPHPQPTPTPIEEDKKDPATQAVAPPTPPSWKSVLYADMKSRIGGKTPGSLVGKWMKGYGFATVVDCHSDACKLEPAEYVPWMVKALEERGKKGAKNRSPMGSYHRTSALLEAEIQRRSELELEHYGNDTERKCAPQLN